MVRLLWARQWGAFGTPSLKGKSQMWLLESRESSCGSRRLLPGRSCCGLWWKELTGRDLGKRNNLPLSPPSWLLALASHWPNPTGSEREGTLLMSLASMEYDSLFHISSPLCPSGLTSRQIYRGEREPFKVSLTLSHHMSFFLSPADLSSNVTSSRKPSLCSYPFLCSHNP